MPNDTQETVGFDPQAVADVFGNEPETTEVSQELGTVEKPKASAVDVPKTDDSKPVSARIAAAKRAEARASQQRQSAQAKEQELARREADIQQRAAQADERDKLLQLMEEDPAAYFEKKKAGPQAVRAHLERLANGLKPEEVQEKRQGALEQELERLKAEVQQRDEAARAEKLQAERSRVAKAAESEFIGHVQENLDAYPHMTELWSTPEETIQAGYALLNREIARDDKGRIITEGTAFLAKHGRHPNHAELCRFLDAVAKDRIESRQNNAWRKRTETADSGREPSSGTVTRNPTVTGKPRTLSARDTSSRATAPSEKWTQEWADEESLRILRGAT